MQVSVIIPTYNRVKDLDDCLDSIIVQTKLPKEVIIVDDSENNEVENLADHRKDEFKEKGVLLRYIKNKRERSLAIARNTGVKNATGDILLFLDSDVVLDKNYITEILKVYIEKPDAKGVQGMIQVDKYSLFWNILGRLHCIIFFQEKDKCRVFPSLTVSYPDPSLERIINCEWLSGANHSYKKEILEEFKWDENLKKYAWGEDIDLPYRIFKKYPCSLFMTPHAKLVHKASQEGRTLKKQLVYMEEVYYLYLFYKNIDQNLKNKLIYLRFRIGRMALRMVFTLRRSESKLTQIKYLIDAPFYCIKHKKEIREGNLEFFNRELYR